MNWETGTYNLLRKIKETDSDAYKGMAQSRDIQKLIFTSVRRLSITITHVVVLRRYPDVLVLVRFFRLALVRAYARDPVQRVLLHAVAHAPYGPTGRVQLVQQFPPGAGHQTAAGRRVSGTAAVARDVRAALEALRAHRGQRRRVLAVALELAGHAPAHHLQHPDLGLLPAHQGLVLRLALGRGVVAARVPHSGGRVVLLACRGLARSSVVPRGVPIHVIVSSHTARIRPRTVTATPESLLAAVYGIIITTLVNSIRPAGGGGPCVRVESQKSPVGRMSTTRRLLDTGHAETITLRLVVRRTQTNGHAPDGRGTQANSTSYAPHKTRTRLTCRRRRRCHLRLLVDTKEKQRK